MPAGARRAREVFERAVLAAPFCLELWEAFAGDAVDEATRGEGGEGGDGKGDGDVLGGKVEDARRYVCCVRYFCCIVRSWTRRLLSFFDRENRAHCLLEPRLSMEACSNGGR